MTKTICPYIKLGGADDREWAKGRMNRPFAGPFEFEDEERMGGGSLLLFNGDRVVRALVDTSSTVKALLLVDHCDVFDRDGTLRADIHASTASNAFILVDLRWHPNTSESLAFRNSSPHINVRDHVAY
jgi:hypothetical protein